MGESSITTGGGIPWHGMGTCQHPGGVQPPTTVTRVNLGCQC